MTGQQSVNSLVVDLVISPEEFERLYQGSARAVVAYAQDGRRVRFPANILVPFVTRSGINGRFQLLFDDNHRFRGIERLDR